MLLCPISIMPDPAVVRHPEVHGIQPLSRPGYQLRPPLRPPELKLLPEDRLLDEKLLPEDLDELQDELEEEVER